MKTKSENIFEQFLATNDLPFEKIEEEENIRTPDYRVTIGSADIIFEIKELEKDENFEVIKDPAYPHIKSSSRTLGDHVRRRIESARKQVQFGANRGIPSVLLIYNGIDPVLQDFGTEPQDFIAAMYGAYTVLVDSKTKAMSDLFHGKDRMLQENKNSSFSAIGHLADRSEKTTVALYENVFAKVKIRYDELPACFEVRRIEVSIDALIIP